MKASGERGLCRLTTTDRNGLEGSDHRSRRINSATDDRQQLMPMEKKSAQQGGCGAVYLLADGGYWDTTSLLDPADERH